MLTVLYITNRGLYPLARSPLGQYDLLAACLESQVFTDYEVVVVDLANTLPRPEVEYAARRSAGGVKFMRPRATPWTRLGAFAPNAARNTGLACAAGEVVVGLDDCYEFGPRYLARVAELHAVGTYPASVLSQVDDSVAYPPQPLGPIAAEVPIGGICAYPLAAAVAVNGWDERFDGASGGDIDFTWRLRAHGVKFVRDAEVAVRGHDHGGRAAAHPRCERVVLDLAARRRAKGLLRANEPWDAAELAAFDGCGRVARECSYNGFPCVYNHDEPEHVRALRLGYESQPWFNLAAAREANGL